MLKKFANLSPRGYQLLGAKVRPCQTSAHKSLYSEDESASHGKDNKQLVAFNSMQYGKDGLSDILCAENIILSILQSAVRASPSKQIEKLLEFCKKRNDQRYRASVGERLYLWCSGVIAATSVLVFQRWFSRNDINSKTPPWFNPETIQQALKGHILGVPRERLLLSVKATNDSIKTAAKEKTTIEEAAQKFKAKSDECTASILNKLGMQHMSSNQQKQAVELFRAASETGYSSAIYNMGLCFEHGRGVPQDLKKSVEYYEIAASKGHGKSLYNLATFYAKGAPGLNKNHTKAVELLTQAADNGIAKAQVYLGIHFAKQNDQSNSAKYFSLASDQKDAVGMYHYAVCLENGWGVRKDVTKAGMLYEEAAEMGHVSAMFNTAVYYENGLGDFTKSRRKAMDWYDKAADFGDAEARKKFKELLAAPRESKNLMHPILIDLLTWGLFNEKPKQEKDFHRSRSAPNLGEFQSRLKATAEPSLGWKRPENIAEQSSESLSCGLEVSRGLSTTSGISFRLV